MKQDLLDQPLDDMYFMSLALLEAKQATKRGDVPVGAVVVRNGEVLARSSNEKTVDPTAHAEMNAIRKAAQCLGTWNLNSCVLYVTLEPCPMCAGAVVAARMGRVVFGARDPKAGAAGSLYGIPYDTRLNHKASVCGGVMEVECAGILQEYFRLRRQDSKCRKRDRNFVADMFKF